MTRLYKLQILIFLLTSISMTSVAQVLSTTGVPSSLCARESFTIGFDFGGAVSIGNVYIAELSDASGSFISPIQIGSSASTDLSGTIYCTIPGGVAFGAGYIIRVAATNTTFGQVIVPSSSIDISCTTRDYYWLGGSGNWSNLSKWEYTTDDFNFIAATELPTANDNVIIDETTFTSGGTLNVDVTAYCNDFYWDPISAANNPILLAPAGGFSFNVRGDFILSPGVYREIWDLFFSSDKHNIYLDFADNLHDANNLSARGYVDFYGGGSWDIGSDLYAENIGIYDGSNIYTNDYTIDLVREIFLPNGAFFAGASNIYASSYRLYSFLDAGSSTFHIRSNDFDFWESKIEGSQLYNNVIISDNLTYISSDNNYSNLSLLDGGGMNIESNTHQAISGSFIAQGTRANMADIKSNNIGSQHTFNISGSVAVDYANIKDSEILGPGAPYSATNSINGGNNIGWNITEPLPLDYFWVGGTGNWTDFANHWATTSGGSTFHTTEPTRNDNVYFDANSFPVKGTVSVPNDVSCNTMDWTGATSGSQLYSPPPYIINVYGNLVMEDGIYRDVDRFHFRSETGGTIELADNTIKLNSDIYYDTYFDFFGTGTYDLIDSLHGDGLRLYEGATINTNDNPIDLEENLFIGTGTLNSGSSVIGLKGFEGYDNFVEMNSTLLFDKGEGFIDGNQTINRAVFEAGDFNIRTDNTFGWLELREGVNIELTAGTTQTIITEFSALGSRSKMVDIRSTSAGNLATIDLGSASSLVNFVLLQDNQVLANSLPVIAANSIDNGNNVNWTIAAIATLQYYWVGGSGLWSEVSHWATTDGGSTFRSDPPGPKDNVFFTTSSFPSGGKVTILESANCNDMTWNDGSTNPEIATGEDASLTVRGNLQFAAGVRRNIQDLRFLSVSNNVVTFAETEDNTSGTIVFDGSGSWAFQDKVSAQQLHIDGGIVLTNNNDVNLSWRLVVNEGTINLGSSVLTMRSLEGNPANLNAGTSTIYLVDGGIYYADFDLNNVVLTDNSQIYCNCSINNLTLEAGADVKFIDGWTTTINNSLTIDGSRQAMVTLSSTSNGFQSFLVASNPSVTYGINYANIQDISLDNASGFTTLVNADFSQDNGNNVGFNFANAPLVPLYYFWKNGEGNWSDLSHWETSPTLGGVRTAALEAPGSADEVIFTDQSFQVANESVFLDIPVVIKNMTWQDGSLTPIIDDGPDNNTMTITGSIFMANGVQRSIGRIFFSSNQANNLLQLADNQGDLASIYFEGGGSWVLLDSLAARWIQISDGVLKTNGKPLYTSQYLLNYAGPQGLEFSNSNIYTWYFYGFAPAVAGTETVYFSNGGELELFGGELNNVVFNGNGYISGTNVMNNLTVNQPGGWIWMQEGSYTIVKNQLLLQGAVDEPLEILSFRIDPPNTYVLDPEATAIFEVPASGTVIADYIELTGNHAVGGADFTATNSAAFANVAGWNGVKTGQVILFNTTDHNFSDGAVTLDAQADSGLGLTYSILEGNATISGDQLTPGGPGLVHLEASQSGNTSFAAASKEAYIYFTATNEVNELGIMKEATFVIGQKDFVSNETFFDVNKTPFARKAFVTPDGKLITSGRARALIWNTVPDKADVPADLVLGQPDFITNQFVLNASSIYTSAFSIGMTDDGRLLIADNRGILIWNTFPTSNGAPADVIIGQDDFLSFESEAAANRFVGTIFFTISPDQKLIVSDITGGRVLIFNEVPTENGASADVVSGQTDFTSSDVGSGATGLNFPSYPSIGPDGKLYIPDADNHRILIYNSIPTTNGAAADAVLGQPDFDSNEPGLGPTSLTRPYSVEISRSGKLAIADRGNQRILIYNSIPANSSVPADIVLGQPDFNTNGSNQGGVSGRSINDAYGLYWDQSENLYVGDLQNNRFLVWGGPDLEAPVVEPVNILSPYYTAGASNQTSVVNVSDRSGLSEAKAYWQEVSYIDPNNTIYEEEPLVDLGDGNVQFDLSVVESKANFPLGIEYFFEFTDNVGNTTTTASQKQILPVRYTSNLSLSTFGRGTETSDYRIIAVPLSMDATVNDIFDDIHGGTYNNTKLRLYEYDGSPATDFTELTGGSRLDVGDAYFALAEEAAPTSLLLPDGVTEFEVNNLGPGQDYRELTLDLKSGWNLIGNPFLHNINWSDVSSYNNFGSQISQLQTYTNGNWDPTITHIATGTGAFVFATNDYNLRIPTRRGAGGRVASPQLPLKNSLSEENWEVRFKQVSANGKKLDLGGFGMNEEGTNSFDEFDLLNPPTFSDMPKIVFEHPEFFYPSFKKDIQARAESGTWTFLYQKAVSSGTEENLIWDNSYFGENAPDIYLVDKSHLKVINMKEENSYNFRHGGTTEFEIYFGMDAYEQLRPENMVTITPYPNPFTDKISINVGLPSNHKDGKVLVAIYNTLGKQVATLDTYVAGEAYLEFIWEGNNDSGQEVPEGVYAYRVLIDGSFNEYVSGKIVKE